MFALSNRRSLSSRSYSHRLANVARAVLVESLESRMMLSAQPLLAAAANVDSLAPSDSAALLTAASGKVHQASVSGDITPLLAPITLSGTVNTAGDQTYTQPVILTGDTTLISGGNITFDSTVDGSFRLTTTSAGYTAFDAAVGGATPLSILTTNGNGSVTLDGNVSTVAGQTYNNAVTLGADVTAAASFGNIDFAATVDGGHNLTVDAPSGGEAFGGAVGDTMSLASLTTNDTVTLNGSVTTNAGQNYEGAVTLGADVTMTSIFDTIDFAATVDGAFNLTVNTPSGIVTFGDAVGGAMPLASLTANSAGNVTLDGNVSTTGNQTYNTAVILGADVTATAGGIVFNSTVDGAYNLVLNTNGNGTTFFGDVGSATPLASLTDDGSVTLYGNVSTTGDQTYQSWVWLDTDVTAASTAGNIDFQSTVDGGRNLVVSTSAANSTTFGDAVGGSAPLASLTATVNVTLDGNVTTSGNQTYGPTLLGGNVTVITGNGTIDFTSTLNGQNHSLTTFGNTIFGGAVTNLSSLTQYASIGATTTVVTSGNVSITYGQPVTFTATVSPILGSGETGTVQFQIDGGNVGSPVTLSGNTAAYTTSTLTAGNHSIVAVYSGDTTFTTSTSSAFTQSVTQAASTVAVTADNGSTTYGQPVTFTATVAPASGSGEIGTVQFQIDGGNVGTPVTLSVNTAAYSTSTLTAGNHTVDAIYSGDGNFIGSTSGNFTQTVAQATPTITWTTPVAITYGTALSATQLDASSGNVAGNFTYLPVSDTVLSAGNQTLSVTFTPADTADYNTGNSSVSLTVNMATTATVVTAGNSSTTYGQPVTFTATVTPASGSGETGTVQFQIDGGNVGSPVTLSGNAASYTTSTLAAGNHSVEAIYSGDANYTGSTSPALAGTVVKASPEFTNLTASSTITQGAGNITFSGTIAANGVSPTTAVAITLNGVTQDAEETPAGNFTTTFNTGALAAALTPYQVTYTFAGDTNFNAVTDDTTTTLTVNSSEEVVYRLYSPVTLEHLYTASANEYNTLEQYVGTWTAEGTAFNMYSGPATIGGVADEPLYRLYDAADKQHFWTDSYNEYNTLRNAPWNWNDEGIAGYVFPSAVASSEPLYRMMAPQVHLWTTSVNEYNTLQSDGWTAEGVIGYVL